MPSLAMSSVLALTACSAGSDGAAAPETTTATAAERTTTAAPTARVGAVPVRLPSDGGLDWRIAVVPDGETALVARAFGNFLLTRQSTIYEVTLQADGSWGDPVEPSFVTDETADTDPFVTADGSRVWFSSIRAVDGVFRPDFEIWYVDRQADGSWAEPVHAAALSSPGDDLFPSIGPDNAVYYSSDRSGAGFDIWTAASGSGEIWAPPSALPAPVNTQLSEFNPAFSPDGSLLVFAAQNRAGGAGPGDDLFISRASSGTWSEPVGLGAVNTANDEYHPSISPDGETLYFIRRGALLEIPVAATELAD